MLDSPVGLRRSGAGRKDEPWRSGQPAPVSSEPGSQRKSSRPKKIGAVSAAAGMWNKRGTSTWSSSNGRAFARRVANQQKAGAGVGGRQELSSIVQAAPGDVQRRVVI